MGQLAVSLRLVSEAPALIEALERFPLLFQQALIRRFLWRLGIASRGEENDRKLVEAAERQMVREQIPIDRFFYDHRGGRRSTMDELGEMLSGYSNPVAVIDPYWSAEQPCSMLIDEVESIWAAIADKDDWALLRQKVDAIRRMGEAYAKPL